MDEAKVKSTIRSILRVILPIIGLFTLGAMYKLSYMHFIYFPDDIPLAKQETIILLLCVVLFITSIYYKIKSSKIIFFVCVVWGMVNIGGYIIASLLYYRQIYLERFI